MMSLVVRIAHELINMKEKKGKEILEDKFKQYEEPRESKDIDKLFFLHMKEFTSWKP